MHLDICLLYCLVKKYLISILLAIFNTIVYCQWLVILWYITLHTFCFLVKLKYLCILTISMITTITNSFHKIFIDSTHQCQWYLCSFISYRFIYIVASDRISCLKPYVIYCVHISLLHYLLIHWRSLVDPASFFSKVLS